MDEIKNELSRVEMELEMQELELEEMIQKRERLKEESRKKKTKLEKVRVHKLIVFASAFFSCLPQNDIFHYTDSDLQSIGKNIYKVCSAYFVKKPKS